MSRAARCALIGSTVCDLDQSAARNVALEGTEISRDHAKFVAVAAERSKSPEEKELRTDKFIKDGFQN